LRIFTTDIANPLTQTEPAPRQDLITGRGQSFLAVTAKNGHPEAKQRMVLEAQGIYFYYYNNPGNVWERKKVRSNSGPHVENAVLAAQYVPEGPIDI
jgi:hypothetical protein